MKSDVSPEKIQEAVRKRYGRLAAENAGCSSPSAGCGQGSAKGFARELGYDPAVLEELPEGANLGLGCSSPLEIAALRPGEVVLDLGSGAGIDCFLAARAVGPAGRVIGVDMTPEMIENARRYSRQAGYCNVEFHLARIESLPLPDETVDVIISNCVVNLCPDKRAAFREVFRVLKHGGRLAIADMVAVKELPPLSEKDLDRYSECVLGALTGEKLHEILEEEGFQAVSISLRDAAVQSAMSASIGSNEGYDVRPAALQAVKP